MTEPHDRLERALEILVYAPVGIGLFLKDAAPTFVDMFVSRGRAEIDRCQGGIEQRVTTARGVGQVAVAFGVPMLRRRVEQAVGDARRRAEDALGIGAEEPGPEAEPAPAAATAAPTTASAAGATPPPVPEPPEAVAAYPGAGLTGWEAATPAEAPLRTGDGPGSDAERAPSWGAAPAAAPSWGAAPAAAPSTSTSTSPSSAAGLPIPGYDALSASQVVERLVGLAADELRAVHAYELSHRQRRTILGKIEQLTE